MAASESTAPVVLRNQEGELEEIEPALATDLLRAGYKTPAPEESAAYFDAKAKQEEQETPLAYAKTAGEGVASGATFGLSSALESSLLHNESEQKAREEAHPILSFGSQAVGVLAPALLAPEAEAAGLAGEGVEGAAVASKAAKAYEAAKGLLGMTPAGLSARGERALAKGIADGLEKALPETTGLLGRVAKKAAAEGGAQAVTGAEFGLGHVIHENALGDPNYTAEALLANPGLVASDMGEGALFAGVLGTLIGGGSGVLEKLRTGDGKAAEWLKDGLDEFRAERTLKAAGGTQKDITALEKKFSKADVAQLMRDGQDMGLVNATDTAKSVAEKIPGAISEGADSANEAVRKTDQLAMVANAKANPGVPLTSARPVDELFGKVESLAKKLDEDFDTKGVAQRLRERLENWKTEVLTNGGSTEDLWNLRKKLDDRIYGLRGDIANPYAKVEGSALTDVRGFITDEIKGRMAPSELAQFNDGMRKIQVAKTFQKLAEHGMSRAEGNNWLSLTEQLGGMGGGHLLGGAAGATEGGKEGGIEGALGGGLLGFVGGAAATALFRRRGSALAAAAASGLRESLEPKAAVLGAFAKNNDGLLAHISRDVRALLSRPAEVVEAQTRPATAEAFSASDRAATRAANLRQAANPGVLSERLAALTQDWHEHAPQTSMAVAVTASRAVNYLASKAPQPPLPTLAEAAAGKSAWRPSGQQAHEFDLVYGAVTNPRGILARANAGRLTPQEVDAVKTVYPRIFKEMQSAALDAITKSKGHIPPQTMRSLELLLGQDLHGRGNNPAVYMAVQQNFQANAPKGQQAPGGNAKPGKPSDRMQDRIVERLSLKPDTNTRH